MTRTDNSLPFAAYFVDHPRSVASRFQRLTLARLWARLGQGGSDHKRTPRNVAAAANSAAPSTKADCALRAAWWNWDIVGPTTIFTIPDDDWQRCVEARQIVGATHIARLRLDWSVDHRGNTSLVHADARIGDRTVHIDMVKGQRSGPGRAFTEVRIFVDGRLEGRASVAGCSLGGGGNSLPAVARIGDEHVVTVDHVDGFAVPIAEVWAAPEAATGARASKP